MSYRNLIRAAKSVSHEFNRDPDRRVSELTISNLDLAVRVVESQRLNSDARADAAEARANAAEARANAAEARAAMADRRAITAEARLAKILDLVRRAIVAAAGLWMPFQRRRRLALARLLGDAYRG